jgi:hypothetical protein
MAAIWRRVLRIECLKVAGLRRSRKVCPSIRRGLSGTHCPVSIGGGVGAQSQVVKNVWDVPTAVDDTDNLDDSGTLPVEDKILAVCKQP